MIPNNRNTFVANFLKNKERLKESFLVSGMKYANNGLI